jgi:hypothetical protein
MEAKELFSAAVRVIGLLSAARGIGDIIYYLLAFAGVTRTTVTSDLPYTDLFLGMFYLAVGLYFVRGAKLIVDYAFPYRSVDQDSEERAP